MIYSNSHLENITRTGMWSAINYAVGFVIGTIEMKNPRLSGGICAISNLASNLFGFLIIGIGKVEKNSTKNKIILWTGTAGAVVKIVALKRLGFINSLGVAVFTAVHLGYNLKAISHIQKLENAESGNT